MNSEQLQLQMVSATLVRQRRGLNLYWTSRCWNGISVTRMLVGEGWQFYA